MKKFLLILAFLLPLLSICVAQEGATDFKEKTFDFGTIPEAGGPVTHEFEFTNNHSTPLVISNVKASCGCTTPFWTKEPIEPGKTGKITVTFNPRGYSSSFSKSITVNTNHEPTIQLAISGKVERAPKDPAQDFSLTVGGLMLKTVSLLYGNVSPEENKSIKLDFYNKTDTPIEPKILKTPAFITAKYPTVIAPKTEGYIEVFLNAPVAGYGKHNGTIELAVDTTVQELNFSSTVVDQFYTWTTEQKKNAAKINISATSLSFDNAKKNKTQTIKFSNSGKSDLHVRALQPAESWVKTSKNAFTIKPNEIVEVKITVNASKLKENFSTAITVFSDDPTKAMVDINVTGNP